MQGIKEITIIVLRGVRYLMTTIKHMVNYGRAFRGQAPKFSSYSTMKPL